MLYGLPGGAVQVVDLEGRPVRTFTGVGELYEGGVARTTLGSFLAGTPDGRNTDVVLADATGRTVRKLATGPKAEMARVVLWFTRK
ncbi:hypothetical protein [Nonomuraea sp. JJY05]|uniref:hypothetical protein n=1 Tax=Nonomuraea sp. JJY05 TaxID=3350255 RepID=UPI00373EAEB3